MGDGWVHGGRFLLNNGTQTQLLGEFAGQFRTHCPCGWKSEWGTVEQAYTAIDDHQAQPYGDSEPDDG